MRRLLFFVLIMLFMGCLARAQEGFKVGVDLPVLSLLSGDVRFDPAVGLNFRFPYGIDRDLSVGASIGYVGHNVSSGELALSRDGFFSASYHAKDWSLWWLAVDCKYLIGDSSGTRPFVLGELGFASLIGNWDNQLSGFIIGAGGGIEQFIGDRWSLHGTALVRYMYFRSGTIAGMSTTLHDPLDQGNFILAVGITYHIPR